MRTLPASYGHRIDRLLRATGTDQEAVARRLSRLSNGALERLAVRLIERLAGNPRLHPSAGAYVEAMHRRLPNAVFGQLDDLSRQQWVSEHWQDVHDAHGGVRADAPAYPVRSLSGLRDAGFILRCACGDHLAVLREVTPVWASTLLHLSGPKSS